MWLSHYSWKPDYVIQGSLIFFFYIGVVKLRLDFDAMSDDVYFNQI